VEDKLTEPPGISRVICRFPLRLPPLTTVTAFQTKGPCQAALAPTDDPALPTSTSFGDFTSAPASFSLSPIEQGSLSSAYESNNHESWIGRLCPGAPVIVTQYRRVRTVQTGVTIENFSLSTPAGIHRKEE